MKTDLLIQLNENEKEYSLHLLLFCDDGFIYGARSKTFYKPFETKELEHDIEDWNTWQFATQQEMIELRKLRKEIHAANTKEIPC